MTCHGGFSLDEATRRSWYNPEAVLKEAGLSTGMVFVDVGCGDGFFSFLAAKSVGQGGFVYAVDSDVKAIDQLKKKAETENLSNIVAKAGVAENTVFCSECADVVFFSMVLHDFRDAVVVLENAKKMLKPEGRLVDLDWKKQRMPFGPPFEIRFSEADVAGLLKMTGFTVKSLMDAGEYHYLITARPSSRC